MKTFFNKLDFRKPMSKIHQPYFAVIVISLLIILEACNSTPKLPVKSKFIGETISTTVGSEAARYYLESYLQDLRLTPDLDVRISDL
jgi:cytochrome b